MYLRGVRCAVWIMIFLVVLVPGTAFLQTSSGEVDLATAGTRDGTVTVFESDMVVDNETWWIARDIVVRAGAELFINNSILTFDTSAKNITVTVEAGSMLRINNCEITGTEIYLYRFIVYGTIIIENSSLIKCGFSTLYMGEGSWQDGIFIQEGAGLFKNSTFDYNNFITAYNSTLSVLDTKITNASFSLFGFNANITIERSNFINNYNDLEMYFCGNFSIVDTGFDSQKMYKLQSWDTFTGITVSDMCSGVIDNCRFYGKKLAMSVVYSTILINNTLFYFNERDVNSYSATLTINNSMFDYPYGPYDNVLLGNEKYSGIESMGGMLNIENTTFNNQTTGIYISASYFDYSSHGNIINSTITNSGVGLAQEGGKVHCENLTVKNNGIGFQFAWGANCNISISDITENNIGLISEWGLVYLKDNFIGRNTGWGIVNSGVWWYYTDDDNVEVMDTFNYIGNNFPASTDKNYEELKNKIGNFVQIKQLDVVVSDGSRNLGSIDVTIENEIHDRLNKNGDIYTVKSAVTDFGGFCRLGMLIEYMMIDDFKKEYCGDYKVTASYKLTDDLIAKNVTFVDPSDIYYDLMIDLRLPDLSLDDSGFLLSEGTIYPGNVMKANTVLYYSGPDYFVLPVINVSLFIDGVRVDYVQFNNITGPDNEYDIELTWKAETGGVPMPNDVEDRQVKIEIEMPDGLEYDKGSYDPKPDNTVTRRIYIELEDEDRPFTITGGTPLASITFFGAIIFGVLLIVIIIRYMIVKRKKGREESKESPEELSPEGAMGRHRVPGGRPGGRGRENLRRAGNRGPGAGGWHGQWRTGHGLRGRDRFERRDEPRTPSREPRELGGRGRDSGGWREPRTPSREPREPERRRRVFD
jgi:hypothetical protein